MKHIKHYFSLNVVDDNPYRVITLTLAILIVLLIGYVGENYSISSISSMGLFTLFYYRNMPLISLVKYLGTIGLTLLLAFILGLLSSLSPWLSPIIVGIVAFISRLLTRLYSIHKPGALFYVMICAMGTSLPIPLTNLVRIILVFGLGITISLIGGLIIKWLDKRVEMPFSNTPFKEVFHDDELALVDAVFYSIALFFSVYISHALGLMEPYWVTMACASILLVENLEAMKKRHIQYLLGTSLGLILAGILLNLHLNGLTLVFVITFIYGLAQYYVIRNYAIANIFINPMAILLSTLIRNTKTISLIEHRFIGILLGSFIGLGTAWLMEKTLQHYTTILSKQDKID